MSQHDSGTAEPETTQPVPPHAQLLKELRTLYATALELPPELLTDEADLEADLGVDSLTQEELLDRALVTYGVTVQANKFSAVDYSTLPEIARLIQELRQGSTIPGQVG